MSIPAALIGAPSGSRSTAMGKGHLTVVLDGLVEDEDAGTSVSRALEPEPGVLRVCVYPVIETAYVVFDPVRTDSARLLGALARAGLKVSRQIAR